jgi:Ribosomal protein L30/L7E
MTNLISSHNKLVAPQVLKILRLFRLNSLYSASLIRLNKATLGMLTKIEPYVTYGYESEYIY